MADMSKHARSQAAVQALTSRRRYRWGEAVPWVAALGVYVLFPEYLPLGTQILIMTLFALSLDIALGYTGIIILGQSAFYGAGAYAAGLLAKHGWNEPVTGLIAAGVVAGCLGALSGAVILRTSGLALLMLGMALAKILFELANKLPSLTGGFDGLQGIEMKPVFGYFDFDIFGSTAFLYCLGILFVVWLFVRRLVHAPYGRSLVGIRENPVRMEFIGTPVVGRKLLAFAVSAGIAGIAGALSAQTNQFVSLSVLSFELSGTVLVILVLGGAGRLYGAFIGAPLYMIAQDQLAKSDPVFWLFWLGLILIAIVLFARGGVMGIADSVTQIIRRRWGRADAPNGQLK